MSAIKARCGEIVVKESRREAGKSVKVVLGPFPYIAVDIMYPHGGGWVHIDRLCGWKIVVNFM